MTLWSARTGDTSVDPAVASFLRAEDTELFPYDCAGTRLHAERLHQGGLLTDAELAEIKGRLDEIAGQGASLLEPTDEDVHSAIERLLGDVGRKIHAGRSRNDQVVTAFRLYVEDAAREGREAVLALTEALVDRAEAEAATIMPGYTHLQRAQPVTLGHHLLAWCEMLLRDLGRFELAAEHASRIALGAGALAGSTLPLPTSERQIANSLDAVADRDFALDYLYATTCLFVHLSRMGEEIVLWTSSEFGFAKLPEHAATGSSMMPQKLNPDVAELARAKAGASIGRLTGLLATLKALPLAYNLDLQEDKPPVFAARGDVARALAALTVLVAGLEFDSERLLAAASDPLLLATDAAEALVADGIAFRDAHEQVAGGVRSGDYSAPGGVEASVAARQAPGPGAAAAAAATMRARLAELRTLP
ncbi:MAG: argininosuccinate lyase [Gaiellaceae bacterium]